MNLFRRAPPSCIFCDIIASNRKAAVAEESSSPPPSAPPPPPPATILFETPTVLAIADKYPIAKHHFLVIPKEHIIDAKALKGEHLTLWGEITRVGNELVQARIDDEGERADVIMGCVWPPFTTVSHLHLHVVSPASRASGLHKYISMTPWFVTPEWVQNRLENMGT